MKKQNRIIHLSTKTRNMQPELLNFNIKINFSQQYKTLIFKVFLLSLQDK